MLEENYDKGHAHHRVAYEALQDSIRHDESEDFDVDKAQEETKKKSASGAFGTTGASDSTQAPPPLPLASSTHQGDQSIGTTALCSLKTATSAEYSHEQAVSSDDEVGHNHIPTVNLRQNWCQPLTKDRPATPEPAWTIPSSDLSMPTNN
ncbi:hypothetical protein Tco_0757558 [Tanacetum coccineum]